METSEAKQIADTIFEQLGGNKFRVMVGVKAVTFTEDGTLKVRFTGSRKYNFLSVKLNSMDLYDMKFWRFTKRGIGKELSFENIYNDQLQEIFTQATGLYTTLGTMGR